MDIKIDTNTLFYFISGSKTYCTNCADYDIICIQNTVEKQRDYNEGIDIFYHSLDEFEHRLKFDSLQGIRTYRELFNIGFARLKEQGKIVGEMPYFVKNYNWFDYKDKIVKRCIEECNNYALNPRIHNSKNRDMCMKTTYWIFANYFALINNSFDLTAEQQEIIQKCHDNELPRTYAEELYQKLLEMLPKQELQEVVQPTISYDDLVDSKIRAKYSISQEFAILRQRDTKPDEFAEYNAYCEQCKAEAKSELGIQ